VKSERPALFCSTVTLYLCVKTRGHLGSDSACIFSFWSVLAKGFQMDQASLRLHTTSIWNGLNFWLGLPGTA
jgi:hypothetical protein